MRLISSCARSIASSERLLGDLIGLALDHHDRVVGAGDDHVERAVVELVDRSG